MQKQGKKFSTGHRSSFSIKLSFGIRHPPPLYQMQCICVGEVSRIPNLQTEFNYLDSFKSYGCFSDFVVPIVPASSPSSPRRPRRPHVVPMSSPRPPEGPHVVPRVCGLRGVHVVPVVSTCCPHRPRRPHVVPIIPMSSPRHLEGPHIIPNPPDTHPHPPGGWGPRISKNAIRFELIEIF